MKKLTIRYIVPALTAFAMMLFAGCDTSEGLGEDIEDAGEGIEESAEEAQ